MNVIYKIYKTQHKKKLMKIIKNYMKMFIYMIWRHTLMIKTNFKFTPVGTVACNNSTET